MVDIIIVIVVLVFVALGLREGLVKALSSVAAMLFALLLANAAVSSLNLLEAQNISTVILFLLVTLVTYFVLDLLLTLLFKRVIYIAILGPVDKFGGGLVGGFKGLLIAGVILQLLLYCPFEAATKEQMQSAYLGRLSRWAYAWAYPFAKNFRPEVKDFIKVEDSKNKKVPAIKKISTQELSKTAGKIVEQAKEK